MEYFADYCCNGDTLKVIELDDDKDFSMVFEVYNQCNDLLMKYEERTNTLTTY